MTAVDFDSVAHNQQQLSDKNFKIEFAQHNGWHLVFSWRRGRERGKEEEGRREAGGRREGRGKEEEEGRRREREAGLHVLMTDRAVRCWLA